MYSSHIYTDLAADHRHDLIAAADAHRVARLARSRRRTAPREMAARTRTRLRALDRRVPAAQGRAVMTRTTVEIEATAGRRWTSSTHRRRSVRRSIAR